MRVLSPTQPCRIYLQFDRLPEPCRPALIVRENGATLLTIDPRSTKLQSTRYCVDHLTPWELEAYRAAFSGPPPGQPGPESWVSDEPVDTFVPEALRLRPRRGRAERSA